MPNWCAGTLRVRGAKENLTKFVLEGLQPVTHFGSETETLKIDDYSRIKCERCWMYNDHLEDGLCPRCKEVLGK